MSKLFQRLGIILVVSLGLLLAIGAFFVWNALQGLARETQALQDAGKPVNVAELGEAASLRGQNPTLQDLEKPLQSLERAMAAATETGDESKDREVRNALFRAFETGQPDLIELLREGASEPGSVRPLLYDAPSERFLQSIYDQMGLLRSATRALTYDAEAELSGGSTDEAALDAIAILRWSENQSREPGIVSHMSCMATRGGGIEIAAQCLYRGDLSSEVREELLDVIAQFDRVAAWSRMIQSERALTLTLIYEWPLPGRVSTTTGKAGTDFFELYEQYESLAAKDWGIDPGFQPTGMMATGLEPALQAALNAHRRVQAQTNAVLILAARQDETPLKDSGRTIDPFDGSPMKQKETADGPIIYAVGADGIDGGGHVQGTDAGIAAWSRQ